MAGIALQGLWRGEDSRYMRSLDAYSCLQGRVFVVLAVVFPQKTICLAFLWHEE